VSDELRGDVLAAMEELSYRPNLLARGLRSGRTKTLGMVVPDNDNPFFAEVARGVEDASFKLGYTVILCNSDGDPDKEQRYVELLIEKQVDGLVFVAAGMSTERLLDTLQASRVPIVVTDRETGGVTADSLGIDNLRGGALAAQHLVDQGHQRIACIAGPLEGTPSDDRITGYLQVLEGHSLVPHPRMIARGNWKCESGCRCAEALLSAPSQPTAIFACNDMMAIGAISAASRMGFRVPEDLSVVGFDDVALASFYNPPLTTVSQPKYEAGSEAVAMLMERIDDPSIPARRKLLELALVARSSSGPAPNASGAMAG
jgi:LacI family transcriptional regulator